MIATSTIPTTLTVSTAKIKLSLKFKENPNASFLERHYPKSIYALSLNETQIDKIHQWYRHILQTPNKGLFLTGSPGCGKTTVAKTFSLYYGYHVKEFSAYDCRNKKASENAFLKMIENVPIDTRIYDRNKYIIIIDELECMTDKCTLNTLIDIVSQKKSAESQITTSVPIIFICNATTEKKIQELRKQCTEIVCQAPGAQQIKNTISKILKKERLTIDARSVEKIIDNVNGDYRRLMNLMELLVGQVRSTDSRHGELSLVCPRTPTQMLQKMLAGQSKSTAENIFTPELVDSCLLLFQQKTQDNTIYQKTMQLFATSNIRQSIKIYDIDKSLLPMMVHENYSYLVSQRYHNKIDQLKTNIMVIKHIITADKIEKIMYNTQSWHYNTIHGMVSCYLPAYYSWNSIKKPSIVFTTTLGKHSLRSSNKKKYINLLSSIGNGNYYNSNDLFYLGKIICYHCLNPDGNINVVKELMKTYNISFDIIDQIIRFSKSSNEYNYNMKKKTYLKDQLKSIKIKVVVSDDDE